MEEEDGEKMELWDNWVQVVRKDGWKDKKDEEGGRGGGRKKIAERKKKQSKRKRRREDHEGDKDLLVSSH